MNNKDQTLVCSFVDCMQLSGFPLRRHINRSLVEFVFLFIIKFQRVINHPLIQMFCFLSYSMGLEPASVRASTLSNINISKTSWPIVIKFHQKHHLGGGFAALGFGLDWIRTLVSMATDSSHRVIMGKTL